MKPVEDRPFYEPLSWLLVFDTVATDPRVMRWCPGRFKHVLAISYVAASDHWAIVDPALDRLSVQTVPDALGGERAARLLAGRGVLRVFVNRESRRSWPRLGCWCVPVVKHMLGLDSWAITPDQLWRACVSLPGTEIVGEPAA